MHLVNMFEKKVLLMADKVFDKSILDYLILACVAV